MIEVDQHHALFTFTRNPSARAKLIRDLVGAGFEVSSFGESTKALEDAYFAQVGGVMNPEFQRNLWLELTPRRMILMVGCSRSTFFAAALAGGKDCTRPAARRNGCSISSSWSGARATRRLAVVGEIRDRTWDMQRLSSLSAGRDDLGQAVRRRRSTTGSAARSASP